MYAVDGEFWQQRQKKYFLRMQNVFSENIHASFSDRNVFPIKMFPRNVYASSGTAKNFSPNLIKWKCVLFIIENYFSENLAILGKILSTGK